ncbi:NUDIX hydrolase [Nanoarchaeota archaeon]
MSSIALIIRYNRKILIGKKRSDSEKYLAGCWHFPGGRIELDESLIECICRESREELNLEVKSHQYLGSSLTPTSRKELLWFECYANTDKINAGDDLEDAKWVGEKRALDYLDEKSKNSIPKSVFHYLKNL